MSWPSPISVLLFMAAFFIGWGASLIWRGLASKLSKTARMCPACKARMPASGLRCPACNNLAQSERDFHSKQADWRVVSLGVVSIMLGFASIFGGFAAERWINGGRAADSLSAFHALGLGVITFAATLALWGIYGDRARGRRRCPKCWYDLRTESRQCSECGHTALTEKLFYKTRRRWRAVLLALVVVAIGLATIAIPRAKRGGWPALLPNAVLIAGMNWLPERAIFSQSPWIQGGIAIGGGPGPGPASLAIPGLGPPIEDWTLEGRTQNDRLSKTERAWLNARIRRTIRNTQSPSVMLRSLMLSGGYDSHPDVLAKLLRAAARALADPDPASQLVAFHLAMHTSWPARAQPSLRVELEDSAQVILDAIQSTNAQTRDTAAMLVPFIGQKHAASAVDGLLRGMLNTTWTGQWAESALAEVIAQSPEAAAKFKAALESDDTTLRKAALKAARSIRAPSFREAISRAARRNIDDSDPSVAIAAAHALSPVTDADVLAAHLPALVAALSDPRASVRSEALTLFHALATSGFDIAPARAAMRTLLNDPDPVLRSNAAWTYQQHFSQSEPDPASTPQTPDDR